MSELKGKSIAITGGTGTIGRACVEELHSRYPDIREIVIYSRDEVKQMEMMEDFPEDGNIPMRYYLGDVRDLDRMLHVLEGVDYLVHAAAIKHVVMAEKNPEECWKTNVLGTKNVVNVCQEKRIKRTILISTDKAQNPAGIYGKYKLEAERLFLKNDPEKFYVVRLGNVVDSRGSVFEIFRKQRKNGVVTVTHPDATRFYISKEMAASFIITKLYACHNQSVHLPEMKSIRIVDLARQIAPECEIKFIGLRPGDKLHEELGGLSSEEALLDAKLSKHGA